jgi:hypothetical protein
VSDAGDQTLIYTALADRLALRPQQTWLEGTLGDAPVQLWVRVTTTSHRERSLEVRVRLPFSPVLDAGLRVQPIGSWEALRATGRSGFAARFSLQGRELDRVESLLDEGMREVLEQCFVGDPGPQLTDQELSWAWLTRAPAPWPTTDTMASVILKLPSVWSGVLARSRTLNPPRGAEDAFVQLAGLQLPQGMELRGCPAGVMGHVGPIGATLVVGKATERGVSVRINLQLPQPLPGSPQIVREDRFSWIERLLTYAGGKGEVELGDATFDQRFAVRSLKPEALQEALDARVRSAMLALDDLLPVHLGSYALGADGPVPVGKLAQVWEATYTLARALGR